MRYRQIKLTEEQLFEINMGMKNLRQLVKGIDARVGMEFEMIVPDVPKNEGGGEMEVDYDQDENANDIDDICGFFNDGDYNGHREIQRLRETLTDAYEQWVYEQTEDAWSDQQESYIYDYVKNNVSDDIIGEELGLEPDEDGNYSVGRVEYQQYAEKCVELENDYYDEAKQEFEDEQRGDNTENDWLDHEGIHRMSNVSDNYDINWPYYTGGDGDETVWDLGVVAELFSKAVGRPAVAGGDYHALSGRERERINSDSYILEIDSSLSADSDDDAGIEFVSPPLTVDEMISDLAKVKAMADDNGCYTSAANKTGLHINVSVAGWKGIENLDYVKLALLLGDEYVLEQFKRQSNTYCKSAMILVRDAVKSYPEDAKALLDKMKSTMNAAASKLIHSGGTTKFTSINTKENRIEFRGPGGDWLNEFHNRIEPTLLRMVVALDAAVDDNKYKKEYQKKLYKLLEPSMDEYGVMVKDFSDYVSGVGGAPEQVVKDFRRSALSALKQSNLAKKSKDAAATPAQQQGNWGIWIDAKNRFANQPGEYARGETPPLIRFLSREAAEQWIERQRATRPNMRADIEVREIAPRLLPGSTLDLQRQRAAAAHQGVDTSVPYELYNRTTGAVIYTFQARNDDEATTRLDDYREHGDHGLARHVATQMFGARRGPGVTNTAQNRAWQPSDYDAALDRARADDAAQGGIIDVAGEQPATAPQTLTHPGQGQQVFTGEWKVVDDNGQELHRFGGIGNVQSDANRVAAQWIQQNPGVVYSGGVRVLPVMSPA